MEQAKRILIVDDEERVRLHFQAKLEKEGYAVELAEDGEKAMQALMQRPFDLLILDIMMPEKDGFEVMEEMSQHPTLQSLPVLLMSSPPNDGGFGRGKLDDSLERKTWITDYAVPQDCFAQGITYISMIKSLNPQHFLPAVKSLLGI
jgi:CheY-like chemotaxis protein